MEAHARHGFPHEVCGVLLGRGDHAQRAVPVENQADDRGRRFAIAPGDLLRIQRVARDLGLEVIGARFFPDPGQGPGLRATLQAAATSKPVTAGATPRRKACICRLVRKRRNDEPAAIVIRNDGRNTHSVENNAPINPATR